MSSLLPYLHRRTQIFPKIQALTNMRWPVSDKWPSGPCPYEQPCPDTLLRPPSGLTGTPPSPCSPGEAPEAQVPAGSGLYAPELAHTPAEFGDGASVNK